jgi:hypothetical protein
MVKSANLNEKQSETISEVCETKTVAKVLVIVVVAEALEMAEADPNKNN